jgi:hypothetical protein
VPLIEEPRIASPRPRCERSVVWWLVGMTLFALAVRLWHLDALLPHLHEPDGDMVTQTEILRHGDPDPGTNPHWASYPTLIARVASLFPLEPSAPPKTLDEHLAAAARPHLVVRVVVAVFSVLLVPAAFGLARLFFSPRWSLVAAALVVTSLMLLNASQQARPHAAAAGWTVLAVLGAARLRRDPRPGSYALASGAAAVAFGILHFGAFAWPALLVAHLLRDRSQRRSALTGLAIGMVALAASILLFHGYLFEPSGGGEGQFKLDSSGVYFGTHLVLLDVSAKGLLVLAHGLWSFDPVLFCLGAVGLAWLPFAAWRARGMARAGLGSDVLVVLAHVVPFLIGAGVFNRAYPRFLVPLLPHCACLAVLALVSLSRVARRIGVPFAATATVLLALAFPTFLTCKSAWLRSQPDSVARLADWIRATPERASASYFATMSFDIPLPRTLHVGPPGAMSEQRSHMFPWWRYQLRHEAAVRSLETYDVRWFVLVGEPDPLAPFAGAIPSDGRAFAVLEFQSGGVQGEDHPLRRTLARRGELVARFGPYDEDDARGDQLRDRARGHKLMYDHNAALGAQPFFEARSAYAARVLAARRLGPILEVYGIPPPDVSAPRPSQD